MNILRSLILGLSFCLTLSLVSCSGETSLNGSIFIATQGGQSIKVGSVRVYAFQADNFEGKYRESKNEIVSKIQAKREEVNNCSSEQSTDLIRLCRSKAQLEIDGVYIEFFQSLKNPVATAVTDADGNFEILLKGRGKFYLVASATRKLPNDSEFYFRALRVSAGNAGQRQIMSNSNIFSFEGSLAE